MNQVAQTQAQSPIVQFRTQLEKRADEYAMVLPSHITPEAFQRTVLTAVQTDPTLLHADRQSLLLACMQAAQDGILPNKREGALVIFNKNYKDDQGKWHKAQIVQYMPMVYGLRKKILQSKEITDITASVVYRAEVEGGFFIYEEGTEAVLRHRPMLEMTEEQAKDSEIVVAYSIATYADGTKSYEVMRRFEINKVQNCSQTGALVDKKGQPRNPSGPWVDWYPEQAKKTVVRRHSKSLPMSGDLLDIEGQAIDQTRIALSAMNALSAADADGPALADNTKLTALPSRNDVNGVGGDQIANMGGEQYNTTTGEIIEGQASEREVQEQLDRQTYNEVDGTQADAPADSETSPSDEAVNTLVQRALDASDKMALSVVTSDARKHGTAFSDEQNRRIRDALDTRAEELSAQ